MPCMPFCALGWGLHITLRLVLLFLIHTLIEVHD